MHICIYQCGLFVVMKVLTILSTLIQGKQYCLLGLATIVAACLTLLRHVILGDRQARLGCISTMISFLLDAFKRSFSCLSQYFHLMGFN